MIELAGNKINSGFGLRESPTAGASTNHKGIDITLKEDKVPSVLGGVVSYVGYSSSGGHMVSIEQEDGTTATYMHLAEASPLTVGTYVAEGQKIGVQGNTGVSTGKHLHFQVEKDGEYLDPAEYLTTPVAYVEEDSSLLGGVKSTIMGFVGDLITFVVIAMVCVLAAYLFIKAFDSNKQT